MRPVLATLLAALSLSTTAAAVPQDLAALWADFDPRAEPLQERVAHRWEAGGTALEVLTYRVGTFKGTEARMAAYYGRPKAAAKVPGLLHLHGGGQRASLYTVQYYAGRGYACLSINWGGKPLDEKHPDWPATDWGAVDPTQQNVPGYSSVQPGPKTLQTVPSPKNNNWYLLTVAARRGLTLLERRPEVDARRLGVIGHSMGGRITFMTAGCDDRVRAAVPSVGGVGLRTVDAPGLSTAARPPPPSTGGRWRRRPAPRTCGARSCSSAPRTTSTPGRRASTGATPSCRTRIGASCCRRT